MLQKFKQTLLFSGLLCWLFAPKANAQQLLIEHQLFAPGTYAPGQALEMADMDGDGDLDLFTKDHASSSALIYLNQQGIMDSLPQVIESDIILRTYSLTDWNADGLPDLLIDNYSAPKIYIRYNLGGLNFGPAQLLLDGSNFIYLYQKDLNNDGFVDLYNLYSSVNNPTLILVFENNGGLPSATPIQRNWQTGTTVGFGDLDGDGKLEQIISNAIGGFYTELLILRDTGNYDFVIDQTINIVDFSYGLIQVVDLDKDGRSEIIYVSADVSWRIIRQTTLGQYVDTPIGISGFANSPSELFSIYDFDGNGFEDLHIGTDLYLNDQFNFTKIALQDAPAVSARFGDTNADGILEAWWAGLGIRSKDYLGNGQYSATKVFVQAWTVLGSSTAMDVENDGDIDFLFISAFEYLVLSRNNNGNYTESVLYGFPIYPNFMIQFDYNGDGFMDFLAGRLIFQNDGQGNFAIPKDADLNYILLPAGKPIGADDFNNDGLGDIVMYEDVNFQPQTTFYLNTGTGSFVAVGAPISGEYSGYYLKGTFHDLDGDGWKEMILHREYQYDADFSIFKNHGGTSFEIRHQGFGRFAGVSDMNGDGSTDLISVDRLADFWNPIPYGVWMWPNEGNGNFGLPKLINPMNYGESLLPLIMIDLTGDGLDDLYLDGLGVMANEGFKFGPPIEQLPLSSNYDYLGNVLPIYGNIPKLDFDGDGDLDIWTYGNRLGYLEILLNSPNKIIGRVFFDNNANGIQEPGENPAGGIKFGLDSLGSFAVSDSSGRFGIPTGGEIGTFKVKVLDAQNAHFDITTPIPTLAQITTAQPTDTVQIGLRISGGPKAALEQALSNHRCNETGRLWLAYTGLTNGPSSGELKLIFPNEIGWQDMDSLPGVTLQGKEIHWPLNQLPTLTTQGLWVDFLMPNFQNIGDTLRFVAEITLNDGINAITQRDTLNTILTCAYDPNDKLIANIERFYVGDEHYTLTAPELVEYVVRFQNTGNDTANQVVILDNLSSVFDYSSFEFLSSSHPCRTNLDFTGLLRVEFPNIALPDSSNDVKGSMGYLKFAVSLKPNPPRNEPIRNIARILFDQNPAILTNIAVFRIVDCAYFGAGITLDDLQCEGDKYEIFVPTHGLEQTYQWTFNNQIISEADTATYYLTQLDNTIGLKINNELCQLDTSFYFHSNGGYPDLQLSLDSSAAFCFGSPIEITSNMITEWYRNDTLAAIGYSYLATITQTLTAATSPLGQPCVAKKSIQLTAVPIANPLILEGEPNIFINRCPGDSVRLSTQLINGNWQWLLYDQTVGVIDSSRLAKFSFSIEQSPNANITLTLDTLNCSVTDARIAQMIPEGDIQLWGDTVLCAGVNYANVYPFIDNSWFITDSIYWYRDDALLQVQYFSSGFALQPLEPGEYTFVVFAACNRDTLHRQYYDIQDFVVEIEENGDSLFTSNGQPAIWYYAASFDSSFQQLPDFQSFLAHLSSGYYCFWSPNGNCISLSDTVYYQSSGVSEQQYSAGLKIFPNPNAGVFNVALSEPATFGLTLRITDLAGRLLQEQATEHGSKQQTVQAGLLPNGLYFLQVSADGKVLAVEKFVKQ